MPVPTDVATLWTWLRASAITGLSDGDAVVTWEDQSPNNKDATAAGGATWQTNELDGKAIVRFDGVDDYFTLPSMAALTAATVFVVVKIDTDPPTADQRTGFWDLGTAVAATHFPFTDGTVYDGFGSTVRKTTVNPTPALTSWRVYEVVSAASDWRSYLDGTNLHTTATNTVGFPAVPWLGRSLPTSGYYLDGDVAEFILFDSALATGDRQIVHQYLWDEYGVGVDEGIGPPPSLFLVQSGLRLA